MIKYFNELENKENQILKLIKESLLKSYPISIERLPLEYFEKYKDVFLELSRLNILTKINGERIEYFTDEEAPSYMDFEYTFMDSYVNHESMDFVLTKDGKNKLDFLVSKMCHDDYYDCLSIYVEAVISLFQLDGVIVKNKTQVACYLDSCMKVLKYQKSLSAKFEKRLTDALDEIKKYQVEIPLKPYSPYNLKLPNAWYITPFKHLYNTTGKNGHKEANLIYPHQRIFDKRTKPSPPPCPTPYLKASYKILEDGCITNSDYKEYLNFRYEFPNIYPPYYYYLDNIEKIMYRTCEKKSYNPLLVKIVAGIISAQAGIYNFFYQLRSYSNDYKRDLEIIKQLEFDDILVRCCGFHKVSSILDKVITTSCINYEEEFEEYIKNGWTIDFVRPIVINESKGTIEEYPQEFLTLRNILKY